MLTCNVGSLCIYVFLFYVAAALLPTHCLFVCLLLWVSLTGLCWAPGPVPVFNACVCGEGDGTEKLVPAAAPSSMCYKRQFPGTPTNNTLYGKP